MNELQKLIKLSKYDNPCIDCFFNSGYDPDDGPEQLMNIWCGLTKEKITIYIKDAHNCKHWHPDITIIRFSKDDQN